MSLITSGHFYLGESGHYYLALTDEYIHQGTSIKVSGKDANEVLPGVHRVAALVKRWMMGTHQGSFEEDHSQAYLDEFAFRFNRRKTAHRGMLFYRSIFQFRYEPEAN